MFGIDNQLLEENNGLFTAEEIAQQPAVWQKTYEQVSELSEALSDFISDITKEPAWDIILTGAGTSEYVGNSLLPALLQRLGGRVHSIGTTEIVAAPRLYLSDSRPTLLVSFARSGNSPESVGAVQAADAICSKVKHLFITCNKDGALAKEARGRDDCFSIELTPETHDRGFAMTSSFSSMYLAALLALAPDAVSSEDLKVLCKGTADFIESSYGPVAEFVRAHDFSRVVYLGTGPLKGIAQEAALKILELTAGKMVALNNSPMGFRHGPKSVVDDDTVCIVFLSDEEDIRRYELDLLKEIYRDKGGGKVVAVADRKDEVIAANSDLAYFFDLGAERSGACLALPFVSAAQTIALLYSLKCGITPDNPCPSGEVNRVVKGVEIYPVK